MQKLVVKNIHKQFGSNTVLKGISLEANTGNVISIIGSSGSGKSTLLRCINMLERPNQGEIILNGEPIKMQLASDGMLKATQPLQLQRMRAKLAMVFQHFNLWTHMTVLENVIEAPIHVLKVPRPLAIARAEKYLAQVGILHYMDFYPKQLSGGQQQRVAIARALAMEPEIILFDEPTSALDPELANDVLYIMQNLAQQGYTMIVVTHEMKFAQSVSDHAIFLHQGCVEEAGPPQTIFNNPQSERLRQFLAGGFK